VPIWARKLGRHWRLLRSDVGGGGPHFLVISHPDAVDALLRPSWPPSSPADEARLSLGEDVFELLAGVDPEL
jgi:hypothetical protein